MNTGNTMDVNIMGREFRVVCPADEREELLQAVAYLNKRMREIRDSGKVAGSGIELSWQRSISRMNCSETRESLTWKNLGIESIACRQRWCGNGTGQIVLVHVT